MSLTSTDRAILTARLGKARLGAVRLGFTPTFTTGGAPGTQGGFYGWTRRTFPATTWTAIKR